MRENIRNFLIHYDCPVEYNGFNVLVEAVVIATKYLGEIKGNIKGIYAELASKHKISRLCIERNLLTLRTAWSNSKKFKQLFDEIQTNAKMIIFLAHKCPRPNESVYDILLS